MLAEIAWYLGEVHTGALAVDDVVGGRAVLWLATLAVPSTSNATSPASTILTALSTRPLHSGSLALALSAISATASRHAFRARVSGKALP
jgi:hypothetical protein